jgi:hypothetical protein
MKRNNNQPMVELDIEPKSTPLENLGYQQENQWIKGPSENQPSRGCQVPKILASEGVRNNYGNPHVTTLTGASTLY